ncbi:ABC transporter ATP-binding protein [Halovulum sp. GXIMD14794]
MTVAQVSSSAGIARRTTPVSPGSDLDEPLLRIDDLSVGTDRADLVMDVSLDLAPGETLCLVGESGCGKSLTCLAAMGLLTTPVSRKKGRVLFEGRDLAAMSEAALLSLRGRDIAMIFQDATAALNPVRRVGEQIAEVLQIHEGVKPSAARARAAELFDMVGIPDPVRRLRAYPHELSGGMNQRVMIAMALACRPRLIVADEATTALDVTTQAQILDLLRTLQAETGAAMIFVTHDLGVVAEIADRVAVMYSGRIVEIASADALFEMPQHPYTRGLMACRLHVSACNSGRLAAIEGVVPNPAARPEGCAFAPRCPRAAGPCAARPALVPRGAGQLAACHFPGDRA